MSLLLVLTAFAGKPVDPVAYAASCEKKPTEAEPVAAGLAELAELLRSSPVSNTSDEHDDRLKKARKLIGQKLLCTPESYRDAALALLPSTETKDLDLAAELARHAADQQVPNATFAFTNAFDRSLVSQGVAQKYGTQYGQVSGRLCIYPIDPTFTDAQRAEWKVAPLTQTYTGFLQQQGFQGKSPDEVTLRALNLMCISEKW